jgi:hypothetical protein
LIWKSSGQIKGGDKMSGIWPLKHPVITVFEGDVADWIDITSDWIAREVVKKLKLEPENIGKNLGTVKDEIEKFVDPEIERIDNMIRGSYMIVAEGGLDFDVKQCTVTKASSFIDILYQDLFHEVLDRVRLMDWRRIEEVELSENLVEGESEVEEGAGTRFEGTLENYIFSVFETDVRYFVEEKPHSLIFVVKYYIKHYKISDEEIPFYIKDGISEALREIVYELEKLGSRYINVVEGGLEIGQKTCRIMPIGEFINKIYKATFEQTLGLLGKNPEALSKDYFKEEFLPK